MLTKVKGEFFKTIKGLWMLYGSECWAATVKHIYKMNVAKARLLRWMCNHTGLNMIRNDHICEKVLVAYTEDKMGESRLRWYCHVLRRPLEPGWGKVLKGEVLFCMTYKSLGSKKTQQKIGHKGKRNYWTTIPINWEYVWVLLALLFYILYFSKSV